MNIKSRNHASIGIASGLLAALTLSATCPTVAMAASHRTENFVVSAPSAELAREAAETAELHRAALAVAWLGDELPHWPTPCLISVKVGPELGSGGATTFVFEDGEPDQWSMTVQGTQQRVLDSAIPHEVLHTVLATHIGQPIPRWADEGAAICVEHASERAKQRHLLRRFLTTGRGIPLNRLLEMTEYPADTMPFFSQSFSLVNFLIEQDGGRLAFVEFLQDGLDSGDWSAAAKQHYGYDSLGELQIAWTTWVRNDYPGLVERETEDEHSRGADDLPIAAPRPATTQPTLSIADVIRLVEAEVDDEVIVRHIRKQRLAAPLTTDDLILLTASGTDVAVITTLQDLPVMSGVEANEKETASIKR